MEKLFGEEMQFFGLLLYFDARYSLFVNDLIVINKGIDVDKLLGLWLVEYVRVEWIFDDLEDLLLVVCAVYVWFNFKAWSIMLIDLVDFVVMFDQVEALDFVSEWIVYVDNLLLGIYGGNFSINYCVDF